MGTSFISLLYVIHFIPRCSLLLDQLISPGFMIVTVHILLVVNLYNQVPIFVRDLWYGKYQIVVLLLYTLFLILTKICCCCCIRDKIHCIIRCYHFCLSIFICQDTLSCTAVVFIIMQGIIIYFYSII